MANGYVNFHYEGGTTYFADGSIPAQEAEVAPLIAALRTNKNIKVAAIVNHAVLESPKLIWVHFEATGHAQGLANTIASGLATVSNPQQGVTAVALDASELPAQYQPIFSQLNGTITQLNSAVYEVSVARPDESSYLIGNVPASPALGVGFTFYVQPTSGNNAIINSEFALKLTETQLVLDSLRTTGFTIPAMHDHFIDDNARLYYIHGFANGDITALGTGLYNSLKTIYNPAQ